jgi:hypothetical protein
LNNLFIQPPCWMWNIFFYKLDFYIFLDNIFNFCSRMELKSKQKMSKISIKLKNINENFQCGICQGYIIDATTITECIHSCKFKL